MSIRPRDLDGTSRCNSIRLAIERVYLSFTDLDHLGAHSIECFRIFDQPQKHLIGSFRIATRILERIRRSVENGNNSQTPRQATGLVRGKRMKSTDHRLRHRHVDGREILCCYQPASFRVEHMVYAEFLDKAIPSHCVARHPHEFPIEHREDNDPLATPFFLRCSSGSKCETVCFSSESPHSQSRNRGHANAEPSNRKRPECDHRCGQSGPSRVGLPPHFACLSQRPALNYAIHNAHVMCPQSQSRDSATPQVRSREQAALATIKPPRDLRTQLHRVDE